jgi:signal transduction histidine kinase
MLDRIQQAFERERRFTADASHELRTPLAAIKGKIGVTLSRARTVEEYKATLAEIENEADRLIRLSNDLLLLARIDQGRVQWQPEEIAINDLLLSVVEQLEPLADAQSVKIETQISPGLKVNGSIDHLIRALLNIIHNAIKYSPPYGAIHIASEQAVDQVHIRVTDQGPGIPPEMLPRLTERFFRADADRSRETGGAGLGLAISHEIVRHHDGELTFSSQSMRGTTVSITLPAAISAAPFLR